MTSVRTALLPEELESLLQLTRGATTQRIPISHGHTLVRCGFAGIVPGALIVTIMGHAKLVSEITRASWLAAPV